MQERIFQFLQSAEEQKETVLQQLIDVQCAQPQERLNKNLLL